MAAPPIWSPAASLFNPRFYVQHLALDAGEPTPSHSLMPAFRRMNWARGSESGLFIGERIYHVSGQRYYDKTLIN
jgi:hypothetical protein